jgi:hypothetical protein
MSASGQLRPSDPPPAAAACRSAHLVLLVQRAARGRPGAGADLLEHLEAPRLGERAGDARELPLGKARGFCGGGSHSGKVITAAPMFQRRIRRMG